MEEILDVLQYLRTHVSGIGILVNCPPNMHYQKEFLEAVEPSDDVNSDKYFCVVVAFDSKGDAAREKMVTKLTEYCRPSMLSCPIDKFLEKRGCIRYTKCRAIFISPEAVDKYFKSSPTRKPLSKPSKDRRNPSRIDPPKADKVQSPLMSPVPLPVPVAPKPKPQSAPRLKPAPAPKPESESEGEGEWSAARGYSKAVKSTQAPAKVPTPVPVQATSKPRNATTADAASRDTAGPTVTSTFIKPLRPTAPPTAAPPTQAMAPVPRDTQAGKLAAGRTFELNSDSDSDSDPLHAPKAAPRPNSRAPARPNSRAPARAPSRGPAQRAAAPAAAPAPKPTAPKVAPKVAPTSVPVPVPVSAPAPAAAAVTPTIIDVSAMSTRDPGRAPALRLGAGAKVYEEKGGDEQAAKSKFMSTVDSKKCHGGMDLLEEIGRSHLKIFG